MSLGLAHYHLSLQALAQPAQDASVAALWHEQDPFRSPAGGEAPPQEGPCASHSPGSACRGMSTKCLSSLKSFACWTCLRSSPVQ